MWLTPELIVQALVNGVVIGGIYALVAVGLTLIFGVMGIINVAHGDFLMVAMFASFYAVTTLGMSPYTAILLVAPLMFVFGVVVFRSFISPVLEHPPINQILLTVALSLLIQNLALLAFGGDYRTVNIPLAQQSVGFLGAVIGLPQLIAFTLSVVGAAGLFAFLRWTDLGRAIRAVAQNPRGAALVGVNVRGVYLLTFGLGCACVGIAGPLLVPLYYVHPEVGSLFLLVAFLVVVMGGMGHFVGALLAGLLIGVVESLAGLFVSASLAPIANFVAFVLVLLFRPAGVFRAAARA